VKVVVFLMLVGIAAVARGAVPRFEDDVRTLSEVKLFAFDIVALSGRSPGEIALSRLLKREDKIRPLIEVYNRGTTEAKVYALAAFHHLAPSLFEQCKRDLVGKYNPQVRAMSGCLPADGTLLEFLIRIHHGQYDAYIRTHSSG